jgi:hypothetical protein
MFKMKENRDQGAQISSQNARQTFLTNLLIKQGRLDKFRRDLRSHKNTANYARFPD